MAANHEQRFGDSFTNVTILLTIVMTFQCKHLGKPGLVGCPHNESRVPLDFLESFFVVIHLFSLPCYCHRHTPAHEDKKYSNQAFNNTSLTKQSDVFESVL